MAAGHENDRKRGRERVAHLLQRFRAIVDRAGVDFQEKLAELLGVKGRIRGDLVIHLFDELILDGRIVAARETAGAVKQVVGHIVGVPQTVFPPDLGIDLRSDGCDVFALERVAESRYVDRLAERQMDVALLLGDARDDALQVFPVGLDIRLPAECAVAFHCLEDVAGFPLIGDGQRSDVERFHLRLLAAVHQ